MQVYKSIAAVAAELAKEGVSKDRVNRSHGQGYNFRGIDDIYNALASKLAAHGLVVIPRVLERVCTERTSGAGKSLFYTVLAVEFDFISAEDGSHHTAKTYGEAMDTSDKSTNKAMSAAYKYAMFQVFCIPTEGDNDADGQTHEVKPAPVQVQAPQKWMDQIEAAMRNATDMQALNSLRDTAAGKNLVEVQAAHIHAVYNEIKSAIEAGE